MLGVGGLLWLLPFVYLTSLAVLLSLFVHGYKLPSRSFLKVYTIPSNSLAKMPITGQCTQAILTGGSKQLELIMIPIQAHSNFTQTNNHPLQMKTPIKIILGIVAALIGMGFVMPAIAQWKQEGAMTGMSIVLCLLGAILTLTGAGTAIRNIVKRSV